MQCVIIAGGYGVRMLPHTEKTPKHLIQVNSAPFAHHQLSWLSSHGVKNVVYLIGYLGEQIREYVGDGSKWDLSVSYVDEGQNLKGTAGALRGAYDHGVLNDWFLVLYGDSFLPFDFAELGQAFQDQKRPAMMTVFRNENKYDKGNVIYRDGLVKVYDKNYSGPPEDMQYIDYGVSALRRSLIKEKIPANQVVDLADIYNQLSLKGHLVGFKVDLRFYEIGSPEGLRDFKEWTSRR